MSSSLPLQLQRNIFISIFIFFSCYIDLITSSTTHTCSNLSSSSCPPHLSSFPFSTSPGCGHPWFQINCSTSSNSTSTITINNHSFTILTYQPNSTFLILTPQTPLTTTTNNTSSCPPSSPSFPKRPINLTNSPFHFSDASCSRLSVVKPCLPLTLPNCSLCSWECDLLKKPIHLLHGCQPRTHQQLSEQGCQEDFFGFLEGFLKWGIRVEWDENHDNYFSSCKLCQSNNGGICGFNSSHPNNPFLCFPSKTHLPQPRFHHLHSKKILLFCTFFILGFLILVIAVATAIYKFRGPKSIEEDPATLFLHRHRSANLLPPVFTYEELESSTNKFDPKRKIGDGGFGSVYLGQLHDSRLVAVKKLHRPATNKSFCNEILILSSINHPNLVKLHGYCSDPRGLLLVYDYIPNGTLADHLHGSKCSSHNKGSSSLSWQVRLQIALQTAMALEYLHFNVDPAIVHRDITSSNIFVEKDLQIKVGDFGLSRLLVYPESSLSSRYVWTGPQGTPGYLDPDYHKSFRLTEKSDVYSLGVILLELISGMKAVDLTREKREMSLVELVVGKIQMGCLYQVVDPVLIREGDVMEGVEAVAELAFRCVANEKDDRPDAREVVAELRLIRGRGCGNRKVAAALDHLS